MESSRRAARRDSDATVVVVGAGYFGSRALVRLQARHPTWHLAAVDRDMSVLEPWADGGVEIHLGDAAETLDALLERAVPRWVIPAVPFHLAHAWVLHRLSRTCGATLAPVPPDLPVPNPLEAPTGDLFCGYAAFRCPEDCPEPRGRCHVTGESRPVPLFQLLADLHFPDRHVMGLRSHQLAPGVGGYMGSELLGLLEATKTSATDLILFTACSCQGVLSGLRVPVETGDRRSKLPAKSSCRAEL